MISSASCNMFPNSQSITFRSWYFQSLKAKCPPSNDIEWKMRAFEYHDKRFYLHYHYNAEVQTFIFYVTIAVKPRKASKYFAKVTLKNPNDERNVVSITKNGASISKAVLLTKQLVFRIQKAMFRIKKCVSHPTNGVSNPKVVFRNQK